jgi:hypothetical protein
MAYIKKDDEVNNQNIKLHPKVQKLEQTDETAKVMIEILDAKEMSAMIRILQAKIASGERFKAICHVHRDDPNGILEIPP